MTRRLKWIPLDQDQLKQTRPRYQDLRHGRFLTQPSPYDVPVGIGGEYDEGSRRLSLLLEYVADEPTVTRLGPKGVTLHVGKHSARIYRVDLEGVDLNHVPSGEIIRKVDEYIDLLAKGRHGV